MFDAVLKHVRLLLLKWAIGIVERAGLAVVRIKIKGNCAYLIAANGTYVRFDKEKE